MADGRVHKSLEGWLTDLAAKSPDAARDYLAKAAPVAALTAMQTSTVPPPAGAGTAALTAEEKEAAKLLGIPEDVYATGKEAK